MLSESFNKYLSDKDTNGYCQLYHVLLEPLKNQKMNLLEIGIGTMIPNVHSSMKGYASDEYKPGASLRAWRDHFPDWNIYGMDIQPDTQFSEERIKTWQVDSTNETDVKNLMNSIQLEFDVIIDDGSHYDVHQWLTLKNYLPYLKENGLYIIEDIYPNSRVSGMPHIIDEITGGMPFFFVGVKNNLCIIKKCSFPSRRGTGGY
jgi:hypothetical protein